MTVAIDSGSRFEGLFALARRLHTASDLPSLLDAAAGEAIALLRASRVLVSYRREIFDGSAEAVQRYAAARDGEDDRHRQHAFASALEVGTQGLGLAGHEADGDAWHCLPLVDGARAFGACYVGRLDGALADAEERLLVDLVGLLGEAIAAAERRRVTHERLQHFERLNRVFMTISQDLDLERVQDLVLRMTMELTKAERAFVLLYENSMLNVTSGRDRDGELEVGEDVGISQTACQKVLDTNQGIFVFNTGEHDELALARSVTELQLESVLVVPLLGKSGLIGLLYVDSRSQIPAALEQDLSVLGAIANQGTILIENALLLRQATVDGLTGLFIRSYFMNRLAEETRRTLRYGGHYSVLVLDLDHFKRINDTYGHATGDAALCMVAHELMSRLRNGIDLCGRYGGEEIVVMLPATDTAGALVVADRLRQGIEAGRVTGPNGEVIQVTTSIGLATLPNMARSAAEVFAMADKALYASKRNGRNQVTVYDPSLP